jgi:aspartate/tyrosine/aromatic aminotransferase
MQVLNTQFQSVPCTEFLHVTKAPKDPIISLFEDFKKDPDPRKVNLTIGAYRDEEGKPYVFPVVRKAEEMVMAKNLDKEYLPMDGD